MTAWAVVHLLAAASALVVIALALARGERSPLRRPLAMLAASQFAWSAASVGTEVTQQQTYALLGAAAAPLFPPLALDFVLTFLGKKRQYRWALIAAYVFFALQALSVVLEVVAPYWPLPEAISVYAVALLAGSVPVATLGLWLTVRHLKEAGSQLEQVRTRLLLTALVLVPGLLVTDLLADLMLPVPRLSTLGSFTFNVLLTRLTLGYGLFTGASRTRVALGQAIVLGLFFAVSYLAIFTAFAGQLGALIVALTTLSLAMSVLGWFLFTGSNQAKAGLERFATLGRFSAQMAHDLKNPLAAALGWSEYFIEEFRQRGDEDNRKNAALLKSALDQLNATIDRYQRISKLEPILEDLDPNALVTSVVSMQKRADGKVEVSAALAEGLPKFRGDRDLLASALANLVQNALQAMPEAGGRITVSTTLDAELDPPRLVLSVADTGLGFDARALEQAFELFFTTKAKGSGLGLAFVRQVARAHGGDATLTSREGAGATVSMSLPLNVEKETA